MLEAKDSQHPAALRKTAQVSGKPFVPTHAVLCWLTL
jgi:hypothetical protein